MKGCARVQPDIRPTCPCGSRHPVPSSGLHSRMESAEQSPASSLANGESCRTAIPPAVTRALFFRDWRVPHKDVALPRRRRSPSDTAAYPADTGSSAGQLKADDKVEAG